jgi:import inner membrane translocase subunit TIM23
MGQGTQGQDQAVTASDLLSGSIDPTRLHPLANLKDSLDYLVLDDDKTSDMPGASTALPSRGWSDDLQYGTGTTYLSGESAVAFTSEYLNGNPTVYTRA